jgi:peptidoglycan hydrolase-like protein with peptidoglycan-binding domain
MKYFWVTAILCCGLAGCGKTPAGTQAAQVNADTLTLQEADAVLVQVAPTAQTEMVANMVENKDAGPLVEASVSAPPDEAAATVEAPEEPAGSPDGMAVQKALKKCGLYSGVIDGKVGPKTKEAVCEFQRKNNLTVDGKVGPKTWALLQKA